MCLELCLLGQHKLCLVHAFADTMYVHYHSTSHTENQNHCVGYLAYQLLLKAVCHLFKLVTFKEYHQTKLQFTYTHVHVHA